MRSPNLYPGVMHTQACAHYRAADITEDGRPSSEEIPLPPVKAVKSRVLLQFKNGELKKNDGLTSSRPICVTLMPMVLRGKPRLFNVESIWQND